MFQLENLALTPARFILFDLRALRSPVHPSIDPLLQKARPCEPERAEEVLRELKASSHDPVVLICEDGGPSARTAARLEQAGFTQVYVVTGGVAGLLSEL